MDFNILGFHSMVLSSLYSLNDLPKTLLKTSQAFQDVSYILIEQ